MIIPNKVDADRFSFKFKRRAADELFELLRKIARIAKSGLQRNLSNGLAPVSDQQNLRFLYPQSNDLLALYRKHADSIVKNGINYPPDEVNYEQSIVAPAASYTTQLYLLTGEDRYLEAASKHIRIFSLFNGELPDYRVNRIAIRHWDGYWFGKRQLYGDTFPHY